MRTFLLTVTIVTTLLCLTHQVVVGQTITFHSFSEQCSGQELGTYTFPNTNECVSFPVAGVSGIYELIDSTQNLYNLSLWLNENCEGTLYAINGELGLGSECFVVNQSYPIEIQLTFSIYVEVTAPYILTTFDQGQLSPSSPSCSDTASTVSGIVVNECLQTNQYWSEPIPSPGLQGYYYMLLTLVDTKYTLSFYTDSSCNDDLAITVEGSLGVCAYSNAQPSLPYLVSPNWNHPTHTKSIKHYKKVYHKNNDQKKYRLIRKWSA